MRSVGLVIPDVLVVGCGGEAEALVRRSARVVPEGRGVLDAVPQPVRAVLTDGVPARGRSGDDLRAGAVAGEEEDRGLAVVVGHAAVGDAGQLPSSQLARVIGVQSGTIREAPVDGLNGFTVQ